MKTKAEWSRQHRSWYALGYATAMKSKRAGRVQALESGAVDLGPPNVVYPIPLRDGEVTVRLHGIPFDMTRQEAERIAGVISALAVES